jgi:hypothetical protein
MKMNRPGFDVEGLLSGINSRKGSTHLTSTETDFLENRIKNEVFAPEELNPQVEVDNDMLRKIIEENNFKNYQATHDFFGYDKRHLK